MINSKIIISEQSHQINSGLRKYQLRKKRFQYYLEIIPMTVTIEILGERPGLRAEKKEASSAPHARYLSI